MATRVTGGPSNSTRIPVRAGRVSSLPAATATWPMAAASRSAPTLPAAGGMSGRVGYSSSGRVERELGAPHFRVTRAPSVVTMTGRGGRAFTISLRSLPGTSTAFLVRDHGDAGLRRDFVIEGGEGEVGWRRGASRPGPGPPGVPAARGPPTNSISEYIPFNFKLHAVTFRSSVRSNHSCSHLCEDPFSAPSPAWTLSAFSIHSRAFPGLPDRIEVGRFPCAGLAPADRSGRSHPRDVTACQPGRWHVPGRLRCAAVISRSAEVWVSPAISSVWMSRSPAVPDPGPGNAGGWQGIEPRYRVCRIRGPGLGARRDRLAEIPGEGSRSGQACRGRCAASGSLWVSFARRYRLGELPRRSAAAAVVVVRAEARVQLRDPVPFRRGGHSQRTFGAFGAARLRIRR